MEEKILVTYSIKHLSNTEKVKLHYLLRGRNGSEGLLKEIAAEKLADTVLLVSKGNDVKITELFSKLNIPHQLREVLFK